MNNLPTFIPSNEHYMMVSNLKQNSLTLPIIGSSISLICFFLPWIKYDMSALGLDPVFTDLKGSIYILGFQFVMRGATFEVLTFLAILVILGVCIYMLKQKTPWKSRMTVIICSSYGCIYVSISLIVSVIADINLVSKKFEFAPPDANLDKFASLQFGMYGLAIGFIIAFLGAWNIFIPKPSVMDNE